MRPARRALGWKDGRRSARSAWSAQCSVAVRVAPSKERRRCSRAESHRLEGSCPRVVPRAAPRGAPDVRSPMRGRSSRGVQPSPARRRVPHGKPRFSVGERTSPARRRIPDGEPWWFTRLLREAASPNPSRWIPVWDRAPTARPPCPEPPVLSPCPKRTESESGEIADTAALRGPTSPAARRRAGDAGAVRPALRDDGGPSTAETDRGGAEAGQGDGGGEPGEDRRGAVLGCEVAGDHRRYAHREVAE